MPEEGGRPMFVQVVSGTVADVALLDRQQQVWLADVRPRAVGMLGTTTGMTLNGRSVTIARYESADAARVDLERPERLAWWNETSRAFADDLAVHDCPDVDVYVDDI